jgi:hypothetical protein
MAPTDESARRCPECGAALDGREVHCWLCGHAGDGQVGAVGESPAPPRPVAGPLQFSLETLFLVTTLIAVCLGTTLAAPGLGLLLVVVALPALIRTIIAGRQARAAEVPWTAAQKIAGFVASLVITAGIATAGFAAFAAVAASTVAICIGFYGEDPGPVATVVAFGFFYASPILGLGVTAWLFWVSRPRRPVR